MKGRTGLSGAGTTHRRGDVERVEQTSGRSLNGTDSSVQGKRNRSRVTIAVAGLAIALSAAAFVIGDGSKVYEKWRERGLLEKAATALKEGKFGKAAQMADEVVRRHPDSIAALSILADTAEKQNAEEAVTWRERIARLLPKDPESQLNLASAALRFGKLDTAREALNRVSAEARESATFHVVAGWLARAEGNFAEQEEQFAAAVKKEPKNDLYQFNLAALQIRSKQTEKSKNARDTLQRLTTVAPYRTGALRALLNDAVERNDPVAADNFAQQLQISSEVTFGDYLLCLNFYRKLDEKKFRRLLEKVKPFAARDPSDLASLIDWMNENGLAGEVVKWIDKLPAMRVSSPPASISVADAYATVRNWSRLKHWTRTGHWGDADYVRLAYAAIAERHLRPGNTSEFETTWRSAAGLAADNAERQVTLARLATKWQLPTQAEELWVRVEGNPTTRREALDNLRELYRAKDETTQLYAVLERLHESSPNEAPITADLARLGLNIGENVERSHQFAKEAYDRAPNDVNCALTYAYSLQLLGRNAEAVSIIESLPSEQLHEVHAAVYVALILAQGSGLGEAKDYVAAAENGKLYPEEKNILQEAKAKLIEMSATVSSTESPPPTATPAP